MAHGCGALWGACLFLASAGTAVEPAPPTDATIQRLIDQRASRGRPIGVVLAISRPDGRTSIFRAGTAGRAGVALDGDTLFEIGSITKTFTAALLAEMVARGEVKLDDPVERYLPPRMRVPRRGRRQITLLDLATHTSALPMLPTNIHPADMSNPYADYTQGMFEQFLASYTLPREIGARYEYSAVGFGLLGQALGYPLATTWEAAVAERVLAPLGMASTGVHLGATLTSRLAPGHDDSGRETPSWDIPAMPAMGAFRSSANDMLKFLAANMDASSRPLGPVLAMTRPSRVVMDEETRVGLAWQTGHATNRTIVWHGGGTGGYRALVAFDPGSRLGVVLLANSSSGADDIGFHLLDARLPLDEVP